MSAPNPTQKGAIPNRRIAISRHAALKQRPQGDILVLPERAIRLEGSGAEILMLCSGERSTDEITRILCERYPESKGIGVEVDRFIAEMIELGGLVHHPDASDTEPT